METTDLGPGDDSPSTQGNPSAVPRLVLIAGALIPVALLLALLAWAMVATGGNPGGFAINSSFGEVAVRQGRALDFTATILGGEELTLSQTRGDVVMVDFWSSWCPPCRLEAPGLAMVYDEYAERGVHFIGVAV